MTKPHHPRRKAIRHVWTEAEIATLRERYPNTLTATLAAEMGVPINAIHGAAAKHGIRKTDEYKSEQAKLAGHGVGSRFKPGHATWNKGIPFQSGGRSAETRFKKGHPVHNHRPLGSTRINADGYIEIKIEEPAKWGQLHREVWKQHHGSYPPPGISITFRDENRQNCAIDNLTTATRQDLLARNSCHNHGPEVAQLIQLRGAISRQINRRTKQAKEAA